MRVGSGFDVHQFDDEPPLLIGGVVVDQTRGLAGTSDADVLFHAISDALLGAAALGDVGTFFPSDDDQWIDADSADLLRQVVEMVAAAGYRVLNCDATVISQTVRIAPHRAEIRQNVAAALRIDLTAVSVKATSTDGLGVIGRDEGLAASAVVLLTEL